ncbi:hypothetical protein [Loigolactobacillus backii]|nr:hypothetical protein [Loigolactobacillus backii]
MNDSDRKRAEDYCFTKEPLVITSQMKQEAKDEQERAAAFMRFLKGLE